MSRQSSPDHLHLPSQSHSHSQSPPLPPSNDSSPISPNPSHNPSAPSSSDGYPSWLPKRPPPPAPASTFHSSVGVPEPPPPDEPIPGPSVIPFIGGRKPTPRSVRIVSLQDTYASPGRREATDQTRVPSAAGGPRTRAWSRATGAAMVSPATFGAEGYQPRIPQPKFRARGLHVELLRSPSWFSKVYFWLFPLVVFGHIPLQTFFDFNAVFVLLQVSKFPNPQAPGVPGSGRNWALGAAAYIACWLVWIFIVFIVYELIYSFARRWRIKRPIIFPIYLSAPSFNLVALTSYSHFCFLQHIRYTAFFGETGSLRDGLAETFWHYSQNLPTVALLLPRAGLSLALLLAFSSPGVVDSGVGRRDGTFFRKGDGTLTNYARGVLIANAAWTAWRALVLLTSYIGLWILSGQGCAGLSGPRYRWEEPSAEKSTPIYSDADPNADPDLAEREQDMLPWSWRECTRARVQDAYEFCLTVRPALRWGVPGGAGGKKGYGGELVEGVGEGGGEFGEADRDRVMAAVGFPAVPPPARRGVLSGDLFEPKGYPGHGHGLSDIIPKVGKREDEEGGVEGGEGPRMVLPYPFTARGAQVSSKDAVPFPPSPRRGGSKRATPVVTTSEDDDEDDSDESDDDDDDDDSDEEEEGEEGEEGEDDNNASEEPSTGRASGSMSSLGQPVTSRYPFQFRHPPSRGGPNPNRSSFSSGAPTSHSRISQGTQATRSTGNRESSDSHAYSHSQSLSPRSFASSEEVGSYSHSHGYSGIPMPPRHPQQAAGRGRPRAGTVPVPVVGVSEGSGTGTGTGAGLVPSLSPTSVEFPKAARSRPRAHTHTQSSTQEPQPQPQPQHQHQGGVELLGTTPYGPDLSFSASISGSISSHSHSEASHEAAERQDTVGLLSAAPSPRTSLRHRGSSLSNLGLGVRDRSRSRSGTGSRTSSSRSRTSSSSGVGVGGGVVGVVRARAQSLIQSVGAASASSLELVQSALHPHGSNGNSSSGSNGNGNGSGSRERTRTRTRAQSSMARLEEDVPLYYSDGRTHSRSGSGTTGSVSGGENYTFGVPTRAGVGLSGGGRRVARVEEEEQYQVGVGEGSEGVSVGVESPSHSGSEVGSSRSQSRSESEERSQSQSDPYVSAPSIGQPDIPAGVTPTYTTVFTPASTSTSPQASSPIPIPTRTPRPSLPHESTEGIAVPILDTSTGSPPDISTAAGSYVTAPVTVEGTTESETSGGTVGSWAGAGITRMVDRADVVWRPA